MKISNELGASTVSQTASAGTVKDNSPSFKNPPEGLQSKVNEAIEEAAKAFGHVISAVFGQTQAPHKTDSPTPKDAPKSHDLPHSGASVHGGWDLAPNKRSA